MQLGSYSIAYSQRCGAVDSNGKAARNLELLAKSQMLGDTIHPVPGVILELPQVHLVSGRKCSS